MHSRLNRPHALILLAALGAMPTGPGIAAAGAPQRRQLPEEVPAAWEDTRRYLELRVLEAPTDVHARLALARHQTTRASTLRTGIVQLAQLAQVGSDRELAAAALESWRDALAWSGDSASDVPLYQAYLRLRPQDGAVRARLAEISRSPAAAGPLDTLAAQNAPPFSDAPSAAAAPAIAYAVPPSGVAYPPAAYPPAASAPAAYRQAAYAQQPASAAPANLTSVPYAVPGSVAAQPVTPAREAPLPALRAATGLALATATPGSTARASGVSEAQAKLSGLQEEIASIEAFERSRVPVFSAGTVVRARRGERGLSALTDTELPLQLKFDMGDGKATINITPVTLHASSPSTDFSTIGRFGGGPLAALARPGAAAGAQNDSGLGVGVGYESGNLQADLGTTPLGFIYSDVNAGVRYRLPIGDQFSFAVNLSRRPVTDSVLSFAGARDARTGETWGGVSATGGRLEANWDNGDFGAYGYGAAHRLTGHRVEANTRVEGGAGVYAHFLRTPDSALTAGLAFTGQSFDKNLGYFTFGHGGYFSPQQFVSLAVPVEWRQRAGRFSYQLNGSLGVQHVKTDAAAFFPLNVPLQNLTGSFYGAQNKTGASYNLAAALEYQLDPQWFLGGRVGLDNTRDYRQFAGSLYLRYAFRPYDAPLPSPVNSVRSPYGS